MRKQLLKKTIDRALPLFICVLAVFYSQGQNIVLLNPFEASNYITNYRNKWDNSRHTKSIFLDRTYFDFLTKFFADNPDKYEGIRIFFASYEKLIDTLYTYQKDPKQISIILAPTIKKKADLDAFHVYANGTNYDPKLINPAEFCPGKCDFTTTGEFPTLATPSGPKGLTPLLFLPKAEADEYIDNYRKRYRLFSGKKHSKSLWLPLEDFAFLTRFFAADSGAVKVFSGIRVFFASYNKFIPETFNARKKQITLIFTATRNDNEPDFNALIDFYLNEPKTKMARNKNTERILSENHGELCPSACPQDDGH